MKPFNKGKISLKENSTDGFKPFVRLSKEKMLLLVSQTKPVLSDYCGQRNVTNLTFRKVQSASQIKGKASKLHENVSGTFLFTRCSCVLELFSATVATSKENVLI